MSADLEALKTPQGLAAYVFTVKHDETFMAAFENEMERLDDEARKLEAEAEPEVAEEQPPV